LAGYTLKKESRQLSVFSFSTTSQLSRLSGSSTLVGYMRTQTPQPRPNSFDPAVVMDHPWPLLRETILDAIDCLQMKPGGVAFLDLLRQLSDGLEVRACAQ
jgi:hypothetical protein